MQEHCTGASGVDIGVMQCHGVASDPPADVKVGAVESCAENLWLSVVRLGYSSSEEDTC
jgi:hypothetical protein